MNDKHNHDPHQMYRWKEKPGMWRSYAEALMLIGGAIVCTASFWLLAVFLLASQG